VRVLKEDPRDNTRYLGLSGAEITGAATVYRNGRPLPARLPSQLQPGDVIETGPDAVAVIRFPDGNEIIVDSNSRVRLGSFFIEFGRILASVRGFFEAESENVIAGVEGTEFVFEVARDRSVSVTVLGGTVVCRSKTAGWATRLGRGELLYSPYPNRVSPGKRLATQKELDDIRRWIKKVEQSTEQPTPDADRPGYCCSGGKVYRSTAGSCRGVFAPTESEAYRHCQDAQQGYCCSDGEVTQTSRSKCSGSFFNDRSEAIRNCRPKPEIGYCCFRGDVFQSTRENCRGSFFLDEAQARAACRSKIPELKPLPRDDIKTRPLPRDDIKTRPYEPSGPVIR
jgi:hypothetical protein